MRPFRRLSGVMALLLMALLANLSWIQVVDADSIRQRQDNTRLLLEQYNKARGPILVESTPIAASTRSEGENFFQRSYTDGPLYAAATGYYSLLYGATGIERVENGVLNGDDPRLFVDRLQQLFAGRRQAGGAVSLTLSAEAQRAAHDGLLGRSGAVVALDARTGAILALQSMPTFDPQMLAPNDPGEVRGAYERLVSDSEQPLRNRALQQEYPPGAIGNLVLVAAALESGRFTLDSMLPAPANYTVPGTAQLVHTDNGKPCAPQRRMTLRAALVRGCRTSFAWLGNALGADVLSRTARQFGFGASLTLPLPVAVSAPERATPLQLAMIAGAIASRGSVMRPYLVQDLRGPDLSVLDRTREVRLGTPMSTSVATQLGDVLRTVRCPECSVPGVGALMTSPDTSAIAIAFVDRFAVAVIVEPGGSAPVERRIAIDTAMAVLATVAGDNTA